MSKGKHNLPDYMLKFKGSKREDNKQKESHEVESLWRDRYGDFAVTINGSDFYILDTREKTDGGHKGAYFQKHGMYNISHVVENLTEGDDIETAVDKAYSSNDPGTPYRLEVFLKDGTLPERDRKHFRQIKEDWMPNVTGKKDKEAEEDITYLLEEEKHNSSRAAEIIADTYGMSNWMVRERYREALNPFRNPYF